MTDMEKKKEEQVLEQEVSNDELGAVDGGSRIRDDDADQSLAGSDIRHNPSCVGPATCQGAPRY